MKGMMKRIALLVSLAAAAALSSACSESAQGPANVLLVTLDTTRADRLGCYGHPGGTSPAIDALAKEGVRFDLAVAQAAVTPVSHASILTGLNPYQHGLRVVYGASGFRLNENSPPTLAEILKEQGFRTAAFVSAFTASEFYGLHRGFEKFESGLAGDLDSKVEIDAEGRADWDVGRNQRRADETVDSALAWLAKEKEPFFLWLHLFDPHDPALTPPDEFCEPFLEGKAAGPEMTRALYDAEVAFMDLHLSRVFELLRSQGRLDDTIVVVTNDHGEGLGDHGWWAHRILYQEQIRMPLVLRLPGGPRGAVVPELVRSIDIAPTILERLGLEAPPMEGKSLLGLVRGEEEPERIAYADALLKLDDNKPENVRGIYDDLMYCAMTRSFKLIHRTLQPEASELYHLTEDPAEQRNVIGEYPEQRESLMKFLEQPGVMIGELIPEGEEDAAARRLKELGY